MSNPQENKKSESNKKRTNNSYVKYSGMAMQMGLTVLIGTFIGQKIDEYYATDKPYFTILLALLAVSAALYLTLKDLIKGDGD